MVPFRDEPAPDHALWVEEMRSLATWSSISVRGATLPTDQVQRPHHDLCCLDWNVTIIPLVRTGEQETQLEAFPAAISPPSRRLRLEPPSRCSADRDVWVGDHHGSKFAVWSSVHRSSLRMLSSTSCNRGWYAAGSRAANSRKMPRASSKYPRASAWRASARLRMPRLLSVSATLGR